MTLPRSIYRPAYLRARASMPEAELRFLDWISALAKADTERNAADLVRPGFNRIDLEGPQALVRIALDDDGRVALLDVFDLTEN